MGHFDCTSQAVEAAFDQKWPPFDHSSDPGRLGTFAAATFGPVVAAAKFGPVVAAVVSSDFAAAVVGFVAAAVESVVAVAS